jgi:hypothetical protein
VALALVAGCGTTSLTNMWRDPQYTPGGVKSVLVIAVRKDQVIRRIWEDAFVHQFSQEGVAATPSYQVFPEAMPDTDAVREHVRTKGYDAVLVTSRVGTQEVSTYVPGYVTREPVTVFRPLWGSYVTYYRDVYHPGYTETDSSVHVRTDLWTNHGEGRLLWSGTSQTLDPRNSANFSHEVSDLVVDEMRKQHLIR